MATPTDERIGQQLQGRQHAYRVRSLLGRGGMASVYLATDGNGREVAVKIPLESLLHEAGMVARFVREVRSLARFNHPHVLKVLDLSEDGQRPFVVMPYLAMGSLRYQQPTDTRQGQPVPMRPEEILQWLPGIADALDYLHRQGIVHRDVKPENIMFDAEGHAYVGDFGIIKVLADSQHDRPQTVATGTGLVLGTPHYMAPEILMNEKFDGQADQYALACTVYELLAARVPFPGDAPIAFIGHLTKQPPKIVEFVKGFPKVIERVVLQGLEKEPGNRYPNCRAFADAFANAVRDNPSPRPASKPNIALDPNRLGITTIVCPYCRGHATLPADVKIRTLCCTRCRKVFSTTDGGSKRLSNAPTRQEEQALVETRTNQRRERATPPTKASRQPFPLKVLLILSGALFAFWFLVGLVSLLLEATTLGIVAFVLTIPFLLAGMILAMLAVLGSSSKATKEQLRTCEQALVERRYDDAIREATKVLDRDPECALAYMQRGFAHAKLRQYTEALADLSAAIKRDSTLTDAYAARAHVYRQQGDEARAQADEKKANQRTRK